MYVQEVSVAKNFSEFFSLVYLVPAAMIQDGYALVSQSAGMHFLAHDLSHPKTSIKTVWGLH
jgi:hypothetical protein